ncbi:MAG: hypothetical protein ACYSU6_08030, partial [Planctomycetota bacterium]
MKVISVFTVIVPLVTMCGSKSYAAVSAITPDQIEADWLRQDQLYELEAARAAGESDTRPVDY